MNQESLNRYQALHLAARRQWGDRFLCRAVQQTMAGGTEVTGYRDYTTGDDYRHVDWNLCARHDELRSREYRGTADASTYFLLDCSASMGLGSPTKFAYAQRLAEALVYLSIANLDRVQLLTFADGILAESPAARGRGALPTLGTFLEQASATAASTDLRAVVEQFVRRPQRRGLVVLLSDLLDPRGFESALDLLRLHRYEPYVVQLFTPEEASPKLAGKVEFYDVETQQTRQWTLGEQDLANYQRVFDEFLTSLASYCGRNRLNFTQTSTAAPAEAVLQRMIASSARRVA